MMMVTLLTIFVMEIIKGYAIFLLPTLYAGEDVLGTVTFLLFSIESVIVSVFAVYVSYNLLKEML